MALCSPGDTSECRVDTSGLWLDRDTTSQEER